ncbi:MAG: DNA-3-methyladenine glycosylase family protein [Promethearchaeota archaeon]
MVETIEGPAFFDLALTLDCGQAFTWERVGPIGTGGGGWFEVTASGHVFRVHQLDPPRETGGKCRLEVAGDPAPPASFVSEYFGWNDDYEVIISEIGSRGGLNRLFGKYPGLRLMHQDPWETTLAFLLSSCSSIPRITRNIRNLAAAYGAEVQTPWGRRNLVPTPADLEVASEEDLRGLSLGFRAKYLHSVVGILQDDPSFFDDLDGLDTRGANARLQTLPGVGHKVASCICLFGLGRHDAFPVDTWMLKTMRAQFMADFRELHPQRPLNARWVAEWARQYFGEYAGVAQQYLFHHARVSKLVAPKETQGNSDRAASRAASSFMG